MARPTVDDVLPRLERVKQSGKGWTARCPAHPDKDPSLSVGVGHDGALLLHCHSGCDFRDIIAALGLEHDTSPAARARQPRSTPKPKRKPEPPRYPPRDEIAALLKQAIPTYSDPEARAWLMRFIPKKHRGKDYTEAMKTTPPL